RNLDFERGCGGQVEYEIELGWLLDWQIAWLRATQDLIDILGCASEEVDRAWPVGHETTRSEKVADTVNRWQSCAQRQSVDTGVVGVYERIGAHIKRLRAPLERREGLCDILGAPELAHGDIEAERAGCRPNFSHFLHGGGVIPVADDRQSSQIGEKFAQEFEPLAHSVRSLH